MKHICIIITIIGISLTSCRQKYNDHLYSAVMSYKYLPIPITNQKDSCFYMCDALEFYREFNMYIMEYETFCITLYNHSKTNTYIQLTDSLYKELNTMSIHEVPEINSVYQYEGIKGILNRYTKAASPGYAAFKNELSWEERDFIMYLLFQEGIYTEFSDEDGDAFIRLNSK